MGDKRRVVVTVVDEEGVGFEYFLSLKFSRVAIDQMAEHHGRGPTGVRDEHKKGSSDAAIATMT